MPRGEPLLPRHVLRCSARRILKYYWFYQLGALKNRHKQTIAPLPRRLVQFAQRWAGPAPLIVAGDFNIQVR
jgi:hypothetical protein